jgi:hypothetical protein
VVVEKSRHCEGNAFLPEAISYKIEIASSPFGLLAMTDEQENLK